MIHNLIKLYKENGVLNDQGQRLDDLPLHKDCPSSDICWHGHEKDNNKLDYNKIHLPFIGPYYCNSPFRLAVLGLNFHGHGGLLAAHDLIVRVQSILLNGYKKMHFGVQNYRGSMVFHRLAVYVSLIMKPDWQTREENVMIGESRLIDSREVLADSLNHIVFLNAIKCSPHWNLSRPTPEMWDNCHKRFLVEELKVLSPKILLVLGKATLYTIPKQNFKTIAKAEDSRSAIHQTELSNGPVVVFEIAHPAAPGGNAESIILNAAKLLRTSSVMEILQRS